MIFHKQNIKNSNSGFTLIELLVVVSIIGLLASVVLTSLSSARSKSRDSKRLQTMIQMRTGVELYRTTVSPNDQYPSSTQDLINTVMKSYVDDPQIIYLGPTTLASLGFAIGCGDPSQVSYIIYSGSFENPPKLPNLYAFGSKFSTLYCVGTK